MEAAIVALILLLLLTPFVYWSLRQQRADAARAMAPLEIADDDPEMQRAREQAQQTLPRFRSLYAHHRQGAMVKVRRLSAAGATRYQTADVLEVGVDTVKVRMLSSPAPINVPWNDVADWVIRLPSGQKMGGFTTKAMFRKARERFGRLPPELAREEKLFADR